MGLCKTSNFSIFTFINDKDFKFCIFLQQLRIYWMRFKFLMEKFAK